MINCDLLVKKAYEGRANAYTPYSNFKVGAAVLTEDDTIYTGCNIENASYGATNCAERTAIFKAISEGHQKIKAIAIVGVENDYTYPCGLRRDGQPLNIAQLVRRVEVEIQYSLKAVLPYVNQLAR